MLTQSSSICLLLSCLAVTEAPQLTPAQLENTRHDKQDYEGDESRPEEPRHEKFDEQDDADDCENEAGANAKLACPCR